MTTSITARSAVGFTGSAVLVIAALIAVVGIGVLLTGNESAILLVIIAMVLFTTAIGVLAIARRL